MSTDYRLHAVTHCNMCAAPVESAKMLGRRLSSPQGRRPRKRIGVTVSVMRCSECGLIFPNPLPVPHDIAQHYDMSPSQYWAPRYFEPDPGYFSDQISTFRRLWDGDGTPVALDVGAGIGKCMRSLSAHGFDAHGLEPSPAFRDAAIEHGGIEPERLTLGTVETASYERGVFDFATLGAVLEHLPDPAAEIERVLAWLSPGGLIHIEVPSSNWLTSRLVNLAYRLQGLDFVTNLSPMHPPYHLYEFTAESFRRHAVRSGHSVASVRLLTGHDTFLPGPDSLWRSIMARTSTGMQLEVWLRAAPTP